MRVEIDPNIKESEVIIRAPEFTKNITEIQELIKRQNATQKVMTFYSGSTEFYLEVGDILFFETEDRQVRAHTENQLYTTHQRLYELKTFLLSSFVSLNLVLSMLIKS